MLTGVTDFLLQRQEDGDGALLLLPLENHRLSGPEDVSMGSGSRDNTSRKAKSPCRDASLKVRTVTPPIHSFLPDNYTACLAGGIRF